MLPSRAVNIYYILLNVKIARPDYRLIAKFYEHGENNRFDSFVYTNNQYSIFFQSYTRQTYKEMQNKKHVNTD